MKQKAHCPNCGANLELTVEVSIQGELKPEFKWLAPGEGSDGHDEHLPSEAMSRKDDLKSFDKGIASAEDGESPGVLIEYVDDVIYQILSKAGSGGLSKEELWNQVRAKGINLARFEETLGIMSVRAEIYSLKDQRYRITF